MRRQREIRLTKITYTHLYLEILCLETLFFSSFSIKVKKVVEAEIGVKAWSTLLNFASKIG